MFKNKKENDEDIKKTRELLEKKKQELEKEKQIAEKEGTLPNEILGYCKSHSRGGRSYDLIVIKYNPETKESIVTDIVPINNPVAGLTFESQQNDIKLMLNKMKRSQR